MLVSPHRLLKNASKAHYAIGAFNVSNLELLQGILRGAEAEHAPVILQTSQGAIGYAGMRTLALMIRAGAEAAKIPVALHLDHGTNIPLVKEAIQSGWYTSVMVDASLKSFRENIKTTKAVGDLAHARGIFVEAELGPIPGAEDTVNVKDREAYFTDPKRVREFVEETKCDALAVSVGTRHGMYKFEERVALDFKRLAAIRQAANVPLVLHGASGVPAALVEKAKKYGAKLEGARGVSDAQIEKAVAHGIAKVNIDSDLRLAFTSAVDEYMTKHPANMDPRAYLGAGRDAVTHLVRQKIRLLGSSGKV